MARWHRQILVGLLAVALAAGGGVPLSMAASMAAATAHPAQHRATALDAAHRLAMAADAMVAAGAPVVSDAAPCHGGASQGTITQGMAMMAMPCHSAQPSADPPAADHRAPACPNMTLCCIGAVPAVPAALLGVGAPMTAGAVLALILERAGDGHIPSPLPKIPRA
jgi:hypothetical protein